GVLASRRSGPDTWAGWAMVKTCHLGHDLTNPCRRIGLNEAAVGPVRRGPASVEPPGLRSGAPAAARSPGTGHSQPSTRSDRSGRPDRPADFRAIPLTTDN